MLTLVIGNKNYSSWSLRPWLALTAGNIPFTEVQLDLGDPDFHSKVARWGPVAKVPVLVDGAFVVWDSLAIIEYVAEGHPEAGLWPSDRHERARARSLCAEMHSGFGALRSNLPMNISASLPGMGWNTAVQRDIDRIEALWEGCLKQSGGPFLFGRFGAVDAYYAPVVTRFATYGVRLHEGAQRYCDAVLAHPALGLWSAAARLEKTFLLDDEPYRTPPAP